MTALTVMTGSYVPPASWPGPANRPAAVRLMAAPGVRMIRGPGTLNGNRPGREGMLAMAEADGEVALQDPDALVKEIERTRENLARTIDELTERVSPGGIARRSLARLREQAARPEVQLAAGVALATVAVAAVTLWRRRR
jgi:hypothetical protein